MKHRRILLVAAASLLVAALAFGAFQSAYAQGGGFDPFFCQVAGWCQWEVDVCNPTTGEFETVGYWVDPNWGFLDLDLRWMGYSQDPCQLHGGMKETGK